MLPEILDPSIAADGAIFALEIFVIEFKDALIVLLVRVCEVVSPTIVVDAFGNVIVDTVPVAAPVKFTANALVVSDTSVI